MKTAVLGTLLATSAMLGTATAAWGHAVQTDYFVDLFAEELELEFTATYSTGEPMQQATVRVYAPGQPETPWQQGQTDEAGHFTFRPDQSLTGEWRIEFEKDGHADIRLVPVDETGIDLYNIGHGGSQDVHYAEISPEAIGVLAAVSLGGIVVGLKRRQQPHLR